MSARRRPISECDSGASAMGGQAARVDAALEAGPRLQRSARPSSSALPPRHVELFSGSRIGRAWQVHCRDACAVLERACDLCLQSQERPTAAPRRPGERDFKRGHELLCAHSEHVFDARLALTSRSRRRCLETSNQAQHRQHDQGTRSQKHQSAGTPFREFARRCYYQGTKHLRLLSMSIGAWRACERARRVPGVQNA